MFSVISSFVAAHIVGILAIIAIIIGIGLYFVSFYLTFSGVFERVRLDLIYATIGIFFIFVSAGGFIGDCFGQIGVGFFVGGTIALLLSIPEIKYSKPISDNWRDDI